MTRIAAAAAVVISTVALARPAAAEAPGEFTPRAQRHSPRKALALSMVGTIVPFAIIGAGVVMNATLTESTGNERVTPNGLILLGGGLLLLGPSLGHLYGEQRWMTTGLKVRFVGLHAAAAGAIPLGLAILGCGESCWIVGLAIEGVAAATYATGAVIDLATVRSATRRWNAKQDGVSLSLTPLAIRTPSHAMAAGLGITGRF